MNDHKLLNKRYEAAAWGAVFLLVGILSLIPGQQNDLAVLGIGLILLGLNLARRLSGIPMNTGTITFGLMGVVLGLASLLRPVLGYRFELPFFPVLLLALGVICLILAIRPPAKQPEDKPLS